MLSLSREFPARQTTSLPCDHDITAETDPQFDRRPWGTFEVLDDRERYKAKRMTVDPGQRLELPKARPSGRALGGRARDWRW